MWHWNLAHVKWTAGHLLWVVSPPFFAPQKFESEVETEFGGRSVSIILLLSEKNAHFYSIFVIRTEHELNVRRAPWAAAPPIWDPRNANLRSEQGLGTAGHRL